MDLRHKVKVGIDHGHGCRARFNIHSPCCSCHGLSQVRFVHLWKRHIFEVNTVGQHLNEITVLTWYNLPLLKLELAKYYKDSEMTAYIYERSRNSK